MTFSPPSTECLKREVIVYQDEHIDVYFFDNNTSCLLLLFNEMGYRSNTSSWGGATAKSIGVSYLGFVSKQPNWFPISSMRNAREYLIGVIEKFSKIVSYGHSQGGYAAIKYSSMFRANAVLSFCPQYSISPHQMEGPTKDFRRILLVTMSISL